MGHLGIMFVKNIIDGKCIMTIVHCSSGMLELSDGLHDLGEIKWQLLLCLLGGWIAVFLSTIKGIRSSCTITFISRKSNFSTTYTQSNIVKCAFKRGYNTYFTSYFNIS